MELHKVIDKDKDFYWPHRSEQEEKARILFGRIKAWKMAMDVVHNYFKALSVAEKSFGDGMDKVQQVFQHEEKDIGQEFGGTLSVSFHDFREYAKQISTQHTEFSHSIETGILKQLDDVKKYISTKTSGPLHNLEKIEHSLKGTREQTIGYITKHEKYCRGISVESTVYGDPFITEFQLKEQLTKLAKEENAYNQAMLSFQKDCIALDEHLTGTLKKILGDFTNQMHKKMTINLETVTHLIQRVNLIEPNSEYSLYAKRTGLDDCSVWEKTFPENGEHINYPYKDGDLVNVTKAGILKRQGKVVKSNWKDGFFVLTECGFLHCFNSVVQQKSKGKSGLSPFSWTQNPNFAGNQAPAQKVDVRSAIDDGHPVFSINLRGCTLNASAPDKLSKNVFEILVPAKGGIFGKETKHLLRASSEEEMVDWFVQIKNKAASYTSTKWVLAPNHDQEPQQEKEIREEEKNEEKEKENKKEEDEEKKSKNEEESEGHESENVASEHEHEHEHEEHEEREEHEHEQEPEHESKSEEHEEHEEHEILNEESKNEEGKKIHGVDNVNNVDKIEERSEVGEEILPK